MNEAKITYEPPATCCQAAQCSSLFPPDGNHHCGEDREPARGGDQPTAPPLTAAKHG
jgi:hypothetical protein